MRKLFLLAIICLGNSTQIRAQKRSPFSLSAGISLFVGSKTGSGTTLLPSITVGPGVKFLQAQDFSIALDVPVTAGWNFKHGTYFGIDVPAMINFQFGSAAGNNENAKFGIIAGAGAGYTNFANYHEITTTPILTTSITAHTEFWGYRLKLGASFKPDAESSFVPSVVLNFGKSINGNGGYVFGISLLAIMMNGGVEK